MTDQVTESGATNMRSLERKYSSYGIVERLDKSSSSEEDSSSFFVHGLCIATFSMVLTYISDVLFSNITVIAAPLVVYRNPILLSLLLGLLLHPTANLVQKSIEHWRLVQWLDRWFGIRSRSISAAFVLWTAMCLATAVVLFLSVGLVVEGATAAGDIAQLPGKVESYWTVYIKGGELKRMYPQLEFATDWLKENAATMIETQISQRKAEAEVVLESVKTSAAEIATILNSYGIEAEDLPDPSHLIEGSAAAAKYYIVEVSHSLYNMGKEMASNPSNSIAALRALWEEYGTQIAKAKGAVEEVGWVASYGKGAAGSVAGTAAGVFRSSARFFASAFSYLWASIVSALLFILIFYKLLQDESPWLELALSSFLPGIVPSHTQERLVKQIQYFATSLFTSLFTKFAFMYFVTYGVHSLFKIPFPYTFSLLHSLIHTVTPFGATGRGLVTMLCSLYLLYAAGAGKSASLDTVDQPRVKDVESLWSYQLANVASQTLTSSFDWLDGDKNQYVAYISSIFTPEMILAVTFVFTATSMQAWAGMTAENWAPEMPWTRYITFGGALLRFASWLSPEEYDEGVGSGDTTTTSSMSSIVSPWALTVSLCLYAFARLYPSATRRVLIGRDE